MVFNAWSSESEKNRIKSGPVLPAGLGVRVHTFGHKNARLDTQMPPTQPGGGLGGVTLAFYDSSRFKRGSFNCPT